ncbi:transcription factor MYC/MYB domain-containing protein [Artemisia annua]|uniref:Transcription factor MYC/MYB domain-containing protein n=1 Tax=Artemisia annua TaxID=35608 RepID=A0A2U1Q2G2_ARTAN|nr:transcription factor MYC/MYB domain-containing protein [Artemisia annua]
MEEQQQQLSQSTVTHLLQHTLRSFCIHENSQWVYAVFWRILPRNYPPPKWDTQGGAYDRSRGNRRNWILAWEDGFCNFAASTAAETNSGDYTPYENHEYQQYQGLQPELFFKMSHEIYNYGEGLIGKVAADHNHKWIFKEPSDQEINFLSTWNNSADSHPRTWEAQFQAGIKTIALVAVREGVIQLGSIHKVIEDLSFVVMLRKKLSYIESIPGVLLPHPSASLYPFKPEGYNTTEAWPNFHGGVNDLATPYNQPLNITPSMSSLEALLSKLPSVVPVCSSPLQAPPFCETAQPHFVAVSPEKEVPEEEEEEVKDVGECSSSMSSYGHHHQHFPHHEINVSSCMANNRY